MVRERRGERGGRADGLLPRPRKRLGQHFLVDRTALERIADALAPTVSDVVVEIGPGRGALTDLLSQRAKRVIAVELDRDLVPYLRDRYREAGNVDVIERDVLDVNLGEVAGSAFLLAGNVPYYITTPILFHALAAPRADRSVYLVQREVAQRLVARPGSKEYGALTVNVAAVARAELLFGVPAGAFTPPPKVESAVVRITPLAAPLVTADEEHRFRVLVQSAFGMRRKQMRRVVRSLYSLDAEAADVVLARAGIAPEVRPEVLTVVQFVALLRGR